MLHDVPHFVHAYIRLRTAQVLPFSPPQCSNFEFKPHALQVEVRAPDPEQLKTWDGWVRSRLKLMVKNMEEHVNARPLPKPLDPPPPATATADAAASIPQQDPQTPNSSSSSKFYFLCITKRTAQVRVWQASRADGASIC